MRSNSLSFTTKYRGRSNKLINNVGISPVDKNNKTAEVAALWDTGATHTVIKNSVATQIGLVQTGEKSVSSASESKVVPVYIVNLYLPNRAKLVAVEVAGMELPDPQIGMLVGMNIIGLGDFTVSSFQDVTSFSFRIPSLGRTDYVANSKKPKKTKRKKKK